jgi:hypothetical protein
MWPFAARPLRLEDLVEPSRIDVVTKVVSSNDVTSPLSGLKAAFVQLEALELVHRSQNDGGPSGQGDLFSLGTMIVGDLVTLEIDGIEVAVEVPVRRAELRLVSDGRAGVIPIHRAVPELVPLLAHAKHGGVLCQREHRVLSGDRLRLRAVVERASRVVASRYRSGVVERLLVRDDLAPILLDEVIEGSIL